ncbi:hypothetical protein T484DRAFT_2249653 [Baffinella frigidus]|nr:hypothetical protein T484DRAFT_2249653 [Cryptophyta sp. CCMP2293]
MVTFAKLVPHLRLGLVFVLGFGLGRNFFLLPSFGAGTLQVHESLRTTLAPDPQLELPALNASACTKSKRVGNSGDGGWDVCLDDLPATGCVVYSGGISDSASFDEAISAQPFGCEVHGFDPTLGANLAAMSERFRRGGMHLHDWGLGGTDFVYPAGTAPWVWPGAGYGAFSNPAAWQFYALQTAMAELGHEKLAVFKCDIEV